MTTHQLLLAIRRDELLQRIEWLAYKCRKDLIKYGLTDKGEL